MSRAIVVAPPRFTDAVLCAHGPGRCMMAVSPDGRVLASAGGDATLRLADLEAGAATFALPLKAVASGVACSASTVVVAVGKRVLRVNALSGRHLEPVRLRAPARSLVVSPDGALFAVVDVDGRTTVFRLVTGKRVAMWMEPRATTVAFGADATAIWCLTEAGSLQVRRWSDGGIVSEHATDAVELRVSADGTLALRDADGIGWLDGPRLADEAVAWDALARPVRLAWSDVRGTYVEGTTRPIAEPAAAVVAHPSGRALVLATLGGDVTVQRLTRGN